MAKIQWIFILLVITSHAAAIVFYHITKTSGAESSISAMIFTAILIAGVGVSIAEVLLTERWRYHIAFVLHVLLVVSAIPLAAGTHSLTIWILAPLLLSIGMHYPFPHSIVLSALSILVTGTVQVWTLLIQNVDSGKIAISAAELCFIGGMVALFGGYLIRYREENISVRLENTRLDGLVDRLSRANLEYQEYAKSIEEESTEAERKRITRDIHDVVGYTLTNNITMMEAITDIMRVNPLGVSALVRSARENAEEGLGRVRDALHVLREQQVVYPTGIAAVERMIAIFCRATGVEVEFIVPPATWVKSEPVENTIYHIIQEAMLNSFRHGKATQVRIFLDRTRDDLDLTIHDNGSPETDIKEDIGLAGMRERIDSLGGSLVAQPLEDGFEIRACIPNVRKYDANE